MRLLRGKIGRRGPHVLLGKGIVAAVNIEASQLGLDVGGPLASELGGGRVALSRRPMAPGALTVGERLPKLTASSSPADAPTVEQRRRRIAVVDFISFMVRPDGRT